MSTVNGTNTYGSQQWADISDTSNDETAVKSTDDKEDSLASKDMFLKLLVVQLKNQDPMSPADGTQFVAQLAQFTQLEQSLSMSQDLSAIREALVPTTDDSSSDTEQP